MEGISDFLWDINREDHNFINELPEIDWMAVKIFKIEIHLKFLRALPWSSLHWISISVAETSESVPWRNVIDGTAWNGFPFTFPKMKAGKLDGKWNRRKGERVEWFKWRWIKGCKAEPVISAPTNLPNYSRGNQLKLTHESKSLKDTIGMNKYRRWWKKIIWLRVWLSERVATTSLRLSIKVIGDHPS
jgi:hypothetical protein